MLYGDSYLECNYAAVQDAFQAAGKLALMTVFANHERWDTSNVEFHEGRIRAYDKVNRNSRMRHIDYGLGVFDRRAFDAVTEGEAIRPGAGLSEHCSSGISLPRWRSSNGSMRPAHTRAWKRRDGISPNLLRPSRPTGE